MVQSNAPLCHSVVPRHSQDPRDLSACDATAASFGPKHEPRHPSSWKKSVMYHKTRKAREKGKKTYQLTIHCLSILISKTPPLWPLRTDLTSPLTALSESSTTFPRIVRSSSTLAPSSCSKMGPSCRSHTHTVVSLLPLTMNPDRARAGADLTTPFDESSASVSPSGNGPSLHSRSQSFSNFRQRTLPLCRPANDPSCFPVRKLQTLMVRSRDPVMIRLESNSRQ